MPNMPLEISVFAVRETSRKENQMTFLQVLLVASLSLLLTSCEKTDTARSEPQEPPQAEPESAPAEAHQHDHDAHSAHEHMDHKVLPATPVDKGASVYQLDVEFVAHDGETRTWDDFKGKPLVITMIYSSCTTACPLIVQEVKNILKDADTTSLPVLLVSMDVDRDAPAALADMKTRHTLGDNWTLVQPTENSVREVAAALGIRYRKLPDGEFNHSQVITVLNNEGAIEARAEGLGPQRADVVEAIKNLTKE